ncbi:hypothetical protein [Curtobacterium sp. PhB136]|uniref:hypothetical protein n=1 Tax=Curtobacterium sp. PhB136 TaxID=2485181 RepID=UPI001044AEBB|nr:hypothetical protein [Curtobacterium sp. PhB136]TCK63607.1 hypothetical protein EDF27_2152 [Curtobacterium sp. PhB136]
MTLSKGFTQNSAANPLDARLMDAARFVRSADGSVRTGVLWTSSATGNVVGSTSSMNVAIVTADFLLSRAASDGAIIITNTGSVNLQLDAAPSSNSRIDVVWVKQNDGGAGGQGDADSVPTLGKTTGIASASPVKPSIPAGALELAAVLVPAGVTATNASGVTITNSFRYAALSGSPIRYRSESDMRADTTVATGNTAYVADGSYFYRRAAAWVRSDMDSIAVIQQQSRLSLSSSTTLATLGSSTATSVTYDSSLMPLSNGVVGPVAIAGWYEVTGTVQWTSNSSGTRYLELTQNDQSTNPPAADLRPGATGTYGNVTTTMYCNAGDYIKLKGYQDSGATLTYASRLVVRATRF